MAHRQHRKPSIVNDPDLDLGFEEFLRQKDSDSSVDSSPDEASPDSPPTVAPIRSLQPPNAAHANTTQDILAKAQRDLQLLKKPPVQPLSGRGSPTISIISTASGSSSIGGPRSPSKRSKKNSKKNKRKSKHAKSAGEVSSGFTTEEESDLEHGNAVKDAAAKWIQTRTMPAVEEAPPEESAALAGDVMQESAAEAEFAEKVKSMEMIASSTENLYPADFEPVDETSVAEKKENAVARERDEEDQDDSLLLEQQPSFDISMRTDDDKARFFEQFEKEAPAALDYAALNKQDPDDSVDHVAIPDGPSFTKIGSSFPMLGDVANPTMIAPILPETSIQKSNGEVSSSSKHSQLSFEEEHTEDMASIQSNIEFVETSHVFQEGDISFMASTPGSPSREMDAKEAMKPETRASPARSTASSASRSPSPNNSSSLRTSVLQQVNKRIAKRSRENLANASPASAADTSIASIITMKDRELEQRNLEASFYDQVLQREKEQASEWKQQVMALREMVERLKADNTILSAENDDLKATFLREKNTSKPKSTSVDDNRKQDEVLRQQERLLQGYEAENAKLVSEIAGWKTKLADAKVESEKAQEELRKEMLLLRTELTEQKKTGRDSVMSRKHEEPFEALLEEEKRKARETELALRIEVDELQQKLAKVMQDPVQDARLQVEKENAQIKQKLETKVHTLQSELASFKEREELLPMVKNYVAEREELESLVGSLRQDLSTMQNRMEEFTREKDSKILGLTQEVDGLTVNLNREREQVKEVEQFNSEYKKRIVALEEALNNKTKNPLVDLIRAAKPTAEEEILVGELKAKISRLESDNTALQEETTRRLRNLRVEHDAMVGDYDRRVQQLQQSLEQMQEYRNKYEELLRRSPERPAPARLERSPREDVSPVRAMDGESSLVFKEIIQNLREEIRNHSAEAKQIKGEADSYRLKYMNAQAELQQQTAITKQLESNLRQLRDNLDQVNRKLAESANKPNVASNAAAANLELLKRQQEENTGLRKRLEEVQHKLDANEVIRQSMHDNFLVILRQTQEETSRSSMDHHERALKILREENRASAMQLITEETKRWRERQMDLESEASHWKIRAEELEGQLREAQAKVRVLELEQLRATQDVLPKSAFTQYESERETAAEVLELRAEVERLQKDIHLLEQSQSPDETQIYTLLQKITEMESRFDRREESWRQLMERFRVETEDEAMKTKRRYKSMLEKKTEEVRHFRSELDKMMREMDHLQR